jgi:hypothetical protein
MKQEGGGLKRAAIVFAAIVAGLFAVDRVVRGTGNGDGQPPPPTVEGRGAGMRVVWPAEPGRSPVWPALDLTIGPNELHDWWRVPVKDGLAANIVQAVMVPSHDATKAGVPGPAACREAKDYFGGCQFGLAHLRITRGIDSPERYAVVTGRKTFDARKGLGTRDEFARDLRWFRVQRDAQGREEFADWLCPPLNSSEAPPESTAFPPHPQVLDCQPMARRAAWRGWIGMGRAAPDERGVLFECAEEKRCRAYFVFAGRPVWLEFTRAYGPHPGLTQLHLLQAAWQTLNRQRFGGRADDKAEAELQLQACQHFAAAAPIDSRWNTLVGAAEDHWMWLALSCRRAAQTAQRLATSHPQDAVRILDGATKSIARAGVRIPLDMLVARLAAAETAGGRGSEAMFDAMSDLVRYHSPVHASHPGRAEFEQRIAQAWTTARVLRVPPGDPRRLAIYDRAAAHWQDVEKPQEAQRLHEEQLADAEAQASAQSLLLVRPLNGLMNVMQQQGNEAGYRQARERLTQLWFVYTDPKMPLIAVGQARPVLQAAAVDLVRAYRGDADRDGAAGQAAASTTQRILERMQLLQQPGDRAIADAMRAAQGLR